jgi:hypothetical protein
MSQNAYLVWELHGHDTHPALLGLWYSLRQANEQAKQLADFHNTAVDCVLTDRTQQFSNLKEFMVTLPKQPDDERPREIHIYVAVCSEGRQG